MKTCFCVRKAVAAELVGNESRGWGGGGGLRVTSQGYNQELQGQLRKSRDGQEARGSCGQLSLGSEEDLTPTPEPFTDSHSS